MESKFLDAIEEGGMRWVDRMPWMLANEPLANMSFKAGAAEAVRLMLEEMKRFVFNSRYSDVATLDHMKVFTAQLEKKEGGDV